jgi:hypothetical protein
MRFAKRMGVDLEKLDRAYPTLHPIVSSGKLTIKGTFAVTFEGKTLDRFSIEIDLSSMVPGCLPIVREVGGRIPWKIERHVNHDGTACVCLPEDYYLKHPGDFSLLEFLGDPVWQYFLGQSLVEKGEPWPHGEWGHGHEGREEFYEDLLGTSDPNLISACLELLARPVVKGHWVCFCGSNKRIRDCHRSELNALQFKIGKQAAKRLLVEVRRWKEELRVGAIGR